PISATVTDPKGGKPKTLVIYRDYDGVVAVGLNTGKREWISHSHWSLEGMLRPGEGQKAPTLTGWVQQFKDGIAKPEVLIENGTAGTRSSAARRVYVIDDLQVPPFQMQATRGGGAPPPAVNAAVRDGVEANKLQCISIVSGKLFWELGGPKLE